MTKHKRTILLDLDGVLNQYTGKYDKNFIPPIREGAKDFLEKITNEFCIKIFTVREKSFVKKWIKDNKLENYITDITNKKEPAWLIIDDRCILFNGDYSDLTDRISEFKAWYNARI